MVMTLSMTRLRSLPFLALLTAGLGTSVYLLTRTFQLLANRALSGGDVCSVTFGVSCDNVLLSETSWVLHIPLAGWGVVYYVGLLALLIAGWLLGTRFQGEAQTALMASVLIGGCVSLLLIGVILSNVSLLCPLCLVIHGINLLLIAAVRWMSQQTLAEFWDSIREAVRFVAGTAATPSPTAPWKVATFLNVLLVVVLVYQWIYVESALLRDQSAMDPVQLIRMYEATTPVRLALTDDEPRLGSPAAPAQLVIFSSFQCPGCRELAGVIRGLHAQFPEALSIVYQHYPLSSQCNPRITADRHPRSCQAAWAAQAAHEQGAFWSFHDGLFSRGTAAKEDWIEAEVRDLGLNATQFAADRASKATRHEVAEDIELGTEIRIDATPAIFLNGRRVRNWRYGGLEVLIRHVIQTQPTDEH